MSAGARSFTVSARPAPRPRAAATSTDPGVRPWIRLVTFAALAGYGVQRWALLLRPAPAWRLLGVFALAVALAGGAPLLRRWHRLLPAVAAFGLTLAAFPVSGLRWQWFIHVRIAVSADRIGRGLTALPNALVPYLGANPNVRLVIVLGAAVLLLDAAAVMAFAPSALGDARRSAAALPLLALAVVPSTLIRPQLPYLQGLALFALLAAFLWGERVRRDGVASALAIAAVAGIGAAILAPRIDQHRPWINYRAWAATLARPHVDTFNWNQSYGPLHWPRAGHVVLTVKARTGDYWKAENLDTFNGYAWVATPAALQSAAPALPAPSESVLARWTQTVRVTIRGMQTHDVIAAGSAAPPTAGVGAITQGVDPGTWVAGRALGPGTTYEISTYSPRPSATELAHAGRRYPAPLLRSDLTLGIPAAGAPAQGSPQVTFAPFHSTAPAAQVTGQPLLKNVPGLVRDSPYGGAYALARDLATRSRTAYGFVAAVQHYLSRGYAYNEKPPRRRYPLASFLFADKQGYCQQFSGAMAMLLRMGGIPARVAAGFTAGSFDSASRRWVVTDIDAHAWVEAWFPRYGWVRFDPTPGSAPARSGSTSLAISKPLSGFNRGAAPAPRRSIGATPAVTSAGPHRPAAGSSPWLIAVVLAALAAAAWLLTVLWRRGDSADDLLAELERALARTRRPMEDGATLAALERRFRASPDAAAYVRSLALARYAGQAALPSPGQRRALRLELRRGLGVTGRVRALWALPPRPRMVARRRHPA
jgi:transglutaminase-like putative cysteine protease